VTFPTLTFLPYKTLFFNSKNGVPMKRNAALLLVLMTFFLVSSCEMDFTPQINVKIWADSNGVYLQNNGSRRVYHQVFSLSILQIANFIWNPTVPKLDTGGIEPGRTVRLFIPTPRETYYVDYWWRGVKNDSTVFVVNHNSTTIKLFP
jgi:hypothetical protein